MLVRARGVAEFNDRQCADIRGEAAGDGRYGCQRPREGPHLPLLSVLPTWPRCAGLNRTTFSSVDGSHPAVPFYQIASQLVPLLKDLDYSANDEFTLEIMKVRSLPLGCVIVVTWKRRGVRRVTSFRNRAHNLPVANQTNACHHTHELN